jgi:prephenate dehydrogenase
VSDHGFAHVAVVGTGLIGGSVACAVAAFAPEAKLTLWDADGEVRAAARERFPDAGVPDRLDDAVADADLVILAVPLDAVAGVVEIVAAATRAAGVVVTDTASVKARPLREVRDLTLPDHVTFVGGHPMAGSERSGLAAADETLFQGATWLLTPDERVSGEPLRRLSAMMRTLGARVLVVDADLHDRLMGVASHLPQVVASALMNVASDTADTTGQAVLTVAAGGFRDVTRIAASEPDLWVAILRENRDAVLRALDALADVLGDARTALEDDDAPALRAILAKGQAARRTLPSKERVDRLVDLVVALDDRPGVLAQVTQALGEEGINIEDLVMRHATEGARGALIVGVLAGATADRARDLLVARGFHVHAEPR